MTLATYTNLKILYSVNGRMRSAWIACDFEGNFTLDGSFFHRSQLTEMQLFDGTSAPFLSEFDYWHADEPSGQCDVRGCACYGGGE